jgi:hypothetical protein
MSISIVSLPLLSSDHGAADSLTLALWPIPILQEVYVKSSNFSRRLMIRSRLAGEGYVFASSSRLGRRILDLAHEIPRRLRGQLDAGRRGIVPPT